MSDHNSEESLEKFEVFYINLRNEGLDEEADRLGEIMTKSKNAKEEKKKIFGKWKTKKGSPERAKQMSALNEYGKKRYGMPLERAPGKPNASGKIIDKPDLANEKGTIQHIGNPDSATHEMAHLEVSPHHMPIKEFQHAMDKEWGRSNKVHGYKQQARTKNEYETTGLENKVRRQVGLPAHEKETKEAKGRRDVAADAPGKKITREIPGKKGKPGKRLTGTSENISPEAHERFDQQSRGELKYHPKTGWKPGTSANAKINQRARAASKDPSRKDAKTLMRAEDDSYVAMNEDDRGLKVLKHAKELVLEKIAQAGHGALGSPTSMTGGGALQAESIVGSTYEKEKAKDDKKELMDQIPPRVRPLFEKAIVNEELMKPYASDAQRRWAHTDAGKKALGGEAAVHEWDESSKGKKLPEHVGKSLRVLRDMVGKK